MPDWIPLRALLPFAVIGAVSVVVFALRLAAKGYLAVLEPVGEVIVGTVSWKAKLKKRCEEARKLVKAA